MDARFRYELIMWVECIACGRKGPLEYYTVCGGAPPPHPTLPNGWSSTTRGGPVCESHATIITGPSRQERIESEQSAVTPPSPDGRMYRLEEK